MFIKQSVTAEENRHTLSPCRSLSGGVPVPRQAGVKARDLVREGSWVVMPWTWSCMGLQVNGVRGGFSQSKGRILQGIQVRD